MDMLGELKAQLVNSAALAADTFFLLSGCLTSYWFFKRLCSDAACRFRLWVRMLGRRVIRLLPSYLAVFVCTTILFKYFGNGPLWNGDIPSESSQEDCAVSWWTNLLLLQNFLYVRQPVKRRPSISSPFPIFAFQCFGWSWFVAAEMQCFLACFAILWFLSRRPRLGMALATLATTAFAICHLLIVVFNDYPPSYLGTTNLKELKKLEDYIRNVFIKPYAHGCSYVIGICLGYLLVKLKTKTFRMNTLPKNIIFCSAVVINAATVFSIYDYANGHPWSLVEKGIYASLSRLTWPLTVGAVIVWCRLFPKCKQMLRFVRVDAHLSILAAVSQVMSMDLWNPLAKLTYGVALIHPLIIASLLLTLRDTFHLTILNAVYNGISVTAVSYLVALVLYLCVEGPMLNIRDMYISCEGTSL